MILTRTAMLVMIDLITAGLASGHKIRLFKTDVAPTVNSIITDFTEADFSGYTAGGIAISTFGSASWQSQGAAVEWSNQVTWSQTAITTGNTIFGCYFVSGDLTPYLISAERFASPISMQAIGDQIILSVPVGMSDPKIPVTLY